MAYQMLQIAALITIEVIGSGDVFVLVNIRKENELLKKQYEFVLFE